MNQDFALPLTPANARRLQYLADRMPSIKLPKEIADIANEDRISDHDFDPMLCPYSPINRIITQFVLDCGLRAIVSPILHPEYNAVSILNTLRLATESNPLIITSNSRKWSTASRTMNMPVEIRSNRLDRDDLNEFRSRVLIYDNFDGRPLFYLAREFPKTIVVVTTDSKISIEEMFAALFPTRLFLNDLSKDREELKYLNWLDLAPFYNIAIFKTLTAKVINHSNDDGSWID